MPPLEVTRQRTKKQIAFIKANERYCLNYGGRGACKTVSLCDKLYMRAAHPKAREGLFRKTEQSLKKTTLLTLLEGDGDNPPTIPPGTYTHNRQEKRISINGGGTILYGGLDEPEKHGSLNLTGCAIDEVVQCTERQVQWVDGAVRMAIPDLTMQVYMACNPGPPSHHIAKRFGLALGAKPQPRTWSIHSRTDENPWLPSEYVEAWRALTGVAHKRYFLGLWVGSDGLVYDQWNREVHAVKRDAGWVRGVIGVDEGYTHDFAAILHLVDGDGRIHVAEEVGGPKLQPEEKTELVKALAARSPVEVEAVVSPAEEPALVERFRMANLPSRAAKSFPGSVNAGIQLLSGRLTVPGDGLPRYTVDPDCERLIMNMESYEWLPRGPNSDALKDVPKKELDDYADASRYAVAYIDQNVGAFHLIGSRPEPTTPDLSEVGVSINFQELRSDIDFGF